MLSVTNLKNNSHVKLDGCILSIQDSNGAVKSKEYEILSVALESSGSFTSASLVFFCKNSDPYKVFLSDQHFKVALDYFTESCIAHDEVA